MRLDDPGPRAAHRVKPLVETGLTKFLLWRKCRAVEDDLIRRLPGQRQAIRSLAPLPHTRERGANIRPGIEGESSGAMA
jgi:hypothetical protein